MKELKIFIELTRLNKPTGFMLLFWPCSWGLAFANKDFQQNTIFYYYLLLFFLGSVLMRSAGCIVNDIVDKDLDKKVKRTKTRPLASGKISFSKSIWYVISLCLLAFIILIQFNSLTIFLGLGSMILAFSYPFMKRVTYWPQLFLGVTFNWGIIMAFSSINAYVSPEIIALYVSAIFWTLGYDTIYGVQDVADDEIIGVKSTAIKFKRNIKLFVGTCYFLTFCIIILLFKENLGLNFESIFLTMFFISLIYQISIFKQNKPDYCLRAFKLNNISGLLMFLSILSR